MYIYMYVRERERESAHVLVTCWELEIWVEGLRSAGVSGIVIRLGKSGHCGRYLT